MSPEIAVSLIAALSAIICAVLANSVRREVKSPNGTKTGELVQKIFDKIIEHMNDPFAHEPMRDKWERRREGQPQFDQGRRDSDPKAESQ